MVTIPIAIGDLQLHAILDTGAGVDVAAPSVLKKLTKEPAGTFSGFRMAGDRVDIPLFIVPSLTIGTMTKRNVLIGSFDFLDQVGVQAIVSMNDFRDQPFTLDFGKKILYLETPKSLAQRQRQGSSIPIVFDDYRGSVIDMFAEFKFGDKRALCEIDTGNPGTAVNSRFMEALGLNTDSPNVQRVTFKNITGTEIIRYRTVLPSIALIAAPNLAVAKAEADFSDIIYDCVVGLPFWSKTTMTVNIPGRRLIIR
jgi:hypothetical protein